MQPKDIAVYGYMPSVIAETVLTLMNSPRYYRIRASWNGNKQQAFRKDSNIY